MLTLFISVVIINGLSTYKDEPPTLSAAFGIIVVSLMMYIVLQLDFLILSSLIKFYF